MEVMIKELGTIITGNTPSKKNGEFWNSEDICFVKPDIISDNGVNEIFESNEYISKEAKKKAKVVSKDSIFITCIGSIGKIGIALEGEYAFNQQINAIVPNGKVVPKYLAYNLLYNKPRLVSIANAPVVPIINKRQFGDFTINIDSNKNKQLKVVDVLDKLTRVIEQRNDELSALNDLIKARFIELFGDPVVNEMGWDTLPLENACKAIVDCPHSTPSYTKEDTGFRCIRTSVVKKNRILWDEIEYIPKDEYVKRIQRKKPDVGDIVYTREGAILGIAAIIDRNCNVALGQRSMLISPNIDKCASEFLCVAMNSDSFLDNALKGVSGSASPHINVGDIKAFKMIMPPIELQNQFSDFINQVDKSKVAVQKALDETQLLFDSLMQQYFG